jgi:translation initiation factor 3 subunit I
MRLWEVKTGKLLKTWEFDSSIKRVEFSEDGTQLLGVTEKRQNILSSIVVYDIEQDAEEDQPNEYSLRIVCDESKATVAGFSYGNKYIIAGHEDGSVSQYDGKVRYTLICTSQRDKSNNSRLVNSYTTFKHTNLIIP